MGTVHANVTIRSFSDRSKEIRCRALVDTGATMLALLAEWRSHLGDFAVTRKVDLQIATQEYLEGEVCGPALIQIDGFREVAGEICFLNMNGNAPEVLLGCIALEQSGAGVDPISQQLIHVPYILK